MEYKPMNTMIGQLRNNVHIVRPYPDYCGLGLTRYYGPSGSDDIDLLILAFNAGNVLAQRINYLVLQELRRVESGT